jgi:hypothetical protein
MKYKKIFIVISLLFICVELFSYNRSLYVDNFNSILGNTDKEEKLLVFVKKNNFKTLILYELHKVNKRIPLADSNKNHTLASFISKAKQNYGVLKIAASGESGGFFINFIHPYNNSRINSTEKFDIYNLEYEYWKQSNSDLGGYYCENYLRKNGIPCNRNGSFNYYLESLSIMKLLANDSKHHIEIEAYVGNYKKREIREIVKNTDVVLISGYASNIKNSFFNVKKMLKIISECSCNPKVSIILSAEIEYMGGFLKYNSLELTENYFLKVLKDKDLKMSKKLNLIEFTYYNYSYLQKSVNYEHYRRTGSKN